MSEISEFRERGEITTPEPVPTAYKRTLQKEPSNSPSAKIRVSLDISAELYAKLQSLSNDISGTKSDVLRKSIALLSVAVQARKQGKKIGLVDDNGNLITEIIGFEF